MCECVSFLFLLWLILMASDGDSEGCLGAFLGGVLGGLLADRLLNDRRC